MGYNSLTNVDAANAIMAGLGIVNRGIPSAPLTHRHTTLIAGANGSEYVIELSDDHAYQRALRAGANATDALSKATFKVWLPLTLFDDAPLYSIDDMAGVKPYDSLEDKAAKRCAYIISETYNMLNAPSAIVDDAFLKDEIVKAIAMLNDTKKLGIEVVGFKKYYGGPTVELTCASVDRYGPAPTTSVLTPRALYDKNWDSGVDDVAGVKPEDDWRRCGMLRLAYYIFRSFVDWLRREHQAIYEKIVKASKGGR